MTSYRVLTVFVLVLMVAAGSCATRGSGLSNEERKEQAGRQGSSTVQPAPKPGAAPVQPWNTPTPTPTPPPPMFSFVPGPFESTYVVVVATPDKAEIQVNGHDYGRQTARIDSSGPDRRVEVTISAPGYLPQTWDLHLFGQNETVEVNLQPRVGTLNLMGTNLEGSSITFNRLRLHPGENSLPVGPGTLRVHRFGFQNRDLAVAVAEDAVTIVKIDMVPTPFNLEQLRADLRASSEFRFSFLASAPGSATLEIQDPKGRTVQKWDLGSLEDRNQTIVWDLVGTDGLPAADGDYQAILTGNPPGGTPTLWARLPFTVDRTLKNRAWPSLGPTSGLLWVPTPEVLTPGSVQFGAAGLLHADQTTFQAPLGLDVRSSFIQNWEFEGSSDFRFWDDPSIDSYYLTVAAKNHLRTGIPGFQLAWAVGGTWAGWDDGSPGVPPTDFLTVFPGLRSSLDAGWTWGSLTFLVAPEIDWSVYAPVNGYAGTPEAQGSHFWAYGRFGIVYNPGNFNLGLSAVVRSTPFDQGFGLFAPTNFGFQASFPVPGSPVTLTAFLALSVYGTDDWSGYSGLGVTFLLPGN